MSYHICAQSEAHANVVGCFVLSSLVIKRQLEKSRRPWRIWLWDVAKQLAGQAVIHGLNLLVRSWLMPNGLG